MKSLPNKLYIFYLVVVGSLIIILQLYFRLFKSKNSYSLDSLREYYLVKKWRPPEEPSEPSGPSTMPSLSSSPSGDSLSLGRGNGSQCVYVILLTLTMLISLKLFTYIECSQYLFIIPTFGKDIWATTFNKEAFQSYSVPPLQLEVQKRLFISLEIKDILFITKKHINKHASYVQK